jgi:hypothetical protein
MVSHCTKGVGVFFSQDNNEIEEVETFAFNGADNLTKIQLNHNKIKAVQARMFSKLPGLEELCRKAFFR